MKQGTKEKALTMFEEQRNFVAFMKEHVEQLKRAHKENEAAALLGVIKTSRLKYLWLASQAEKNIQGLLRSPDHRDFQTFLSKAFADSGIRFTDSNEASGFPKKQLRWRESKAGDIELLGETVKGSTKILIGKESDYETHVIGLTIAREQQMELSNLEKAPIDGRPVTASGHVIMIMTEVDSPFSKPTAESIAASLRVGILKRENAQMIGGYEFMKYDQSSPIMPEMCSFLINLCIPELTMSLLLDSFPEAGR